MLRWVAALMAAVTLLTGILATSSIAQAQPLQNTPGAVQSVQGQDQSLGERQGKTKVALKVVIRFVKNNRDRINNTVKNFADRTPMPESTRQWIKKNITAGKILSVLYTFSDVSDTIENWIYRAIERIAPWLPNWISRGLARVIAP
jgi:hypothetical protein